jgi:hypothetical protein
MPRYEINPNNAGTIQLALAGVTPLVEYNCQIVDIAVEPTQNTTTSPGTYCGPPVDVPGASSWAVVISFLQDWGNSPNSLSEFTFNNDGKLCDFEFTSNNPDTVPSMSGQAYVTATAFGGPAGASWQVTTQRWACNAKPTITPAVVVLSVEGQASEDESLQTV